MESIPKIVIFMSVSYLTALLGRGEGGENVNWRLCFLQYMYRGTRMHTRLSAITTAVLTVPTTIRTVLFPGNGVWIGEAASVSVTEGLGSSV